MSLRAIWAISLPGVDHNVLFSKKFPTVERRAKTFNRDAYIPLPNDTEMKAAILEELGILHPSDEFIESRDSCSRKLQKPIFEVKTPNGKLWPVVMYEKFGVLLCCLPLVESVERPPVIDVLGISLGYSLLLRMVDVIGSLPKGADETHPRMVDVHSYLCQSLPFGSPSNIEPSIVFDAIKGKLDINQVPADRPPSWRPVTAKTKANISFRVTEHIQAVLYNKPDVHDVFQIFGSVTCKADLEHPVPLVAVNLSVAKEQSPVQNVMVNPCVQMVDDQNRTSGNSSRTITFIPPRDQFILCKYTASISPTQVSAPSSSDTPTMSRRGSVSSLNSTTSSLTVMGQASPTSLPIKAHYEMSGTQYELNITLKVKLVKGKNFFEFCEVHMPFYNRGPVIEVDRSVNTGDVFLTNEKRTLAWKIGQKFPSRSHEATLGAKLKFGNKAPKSSDFDDPFCVGLNSFAMIYFKIPDYTHTSATIDQRSLRVQPAAKPKVTVVREFLSSSYKVWNIKGNCLMTDMSDVSDSW